MASRSRVLFLFLLLTSLLLASCAPGTSSHGLKAWFVDSLVKIFPADDVGTNRLASARFIAARNQHVNIQIALRSTRPFSALAAHLEQLKDSNGHTIAVSGASIRQVGYVAVGSHTPGSPPDDLVGTAPGWYPDPLLPLPFKLEAGSTHSIWVEIHVPFNTPPGVYRGIVDIDAGQQALARLPFRLTVVAATVPQKRSLYITNWFSLNNAVSQQFFNVSEFSDGWWKLVGHVAKVFAAHRDNVVFTPLMNLIEPTVADGRLDYDFSQLDRWVETFRAAGAIGTIEGSHLTRRVQGAYNGALLVPTFQVINHKVHQTTLPAGDPRVEPFLTSFLRQLYTHLKEKGWAGIYVQHISDEPHDGEIAYYAKFGKLVHRVMPGIKTIDAVDLAHITPNLRKSCDIWVPILGSFDNLMSLVRQRIHEGYSVWYYTCISPQGRYLNRFVDFPLIKTRLLPWLDFRYGLTGFLHWGGNDWTPKPMLDTQPVINANKTLLPSGDAFIYYPDRRDLTFYSSIRMETLLTGIEDYELLAVLKTKDAAEASRLARQSISSFTDYVRDPIRFRKIESQLLQAASHN